ncbi:SAM-dependent methyltransferase [bacterium 1XD42-8]|nr:SAM-dependent methyltransferase [bacterium 1XD42-8]
MERLRSILEGKINENLIQMILSNPKENNGIKKIKIRPVLLKEKLYFQMTEYVGTKVFHKNIEKQQLIEIVIKTIGHMRQLEVESTKEHLTVLVSKKGKMSIKNKKLKIEKQSCNMEHNRKKKYILEEGQPIPFLIDLGVMTKQGKIVKEKYDKFRQINRYLEFIDDVLPKLSREREAIIIDFGCGKSYLTFAMYYYIKIAKGYNIRMIGLDLKEDVICTCNRLAQEYGYNKLEFFQGDIGDYNGVSKVDMVVSLHACDTATDYALAKAIKWNAKIILAVPCCQHELNRQMESSMLQPIIKYGILREKMAALLTDGIRAQILEGCGYDVQILEFIDMEHTPKNILLRAMLIKNGKRDFNIIHPFLEFINAKPMLLSLIKDLE